jgi:hypothetical protein
MKTRRSVGLSRRDMEWMVTSMIRRVPTDPAELTKLISDVVITLIEKNNAAIARSLEADGDEGTHD